MRACSGVWVAHGSGSADRETADRHGRVRVPPGEESYTLRRVWLTQRGGAGLLLRLLQRGPLAAVPHRAHAARSFRSEDWKHYQAVNRQFADAVCAEVGLRRPDRPRAGLPLRASLPAARSASGCPRATIITFWHIPWPQRRALRHLPLARRAARGPARAAASSASTRSSTATTSSTPSTATSRRASTASRTRSCRRGAPTLVRPYPISIEWPSRWAGSRPRRSRSAARRCSRELGLPPDALLGVGVDRLDYTKGVEERLLAVERLLERRPVAARPLHVRRSSRRRAAPRSSATGSSTTPSSALAARINERFGDAALPADRPAARAPRAARRCSATTAPPTSAT